MNEKNSNIYELISKYRSEIMGVTIAFIVLFHLDFNVDRFPFSIINYPISISGGIGVDIFFLVSGFGLYLSLLKNDNVILYAKKRLNRILPACYPILFVYVLYFWLKHDADLLDFISNAFFVSWWLDRRLQFNWYIQVLPFFYLLAIPFFCCFKRSKRYYRTYIFLTMTCVVFNIPFMNTNKYQAFARLPIFLLGMLYAAFYEQSEKENRKFPVRIFIDAVLFGLGVTFLQYFYHTDKMYSLQYRLTSDYVFQLFTPFIVWVLCFCFTQFDKRSVGKKICRLFSALGKASLEIYLIHLLILWFYPGLAENYNSVRIVAFLTFCVSGVLYHKAIEKIQLAVKKKRREEE